MKKVEIVSYFNLGILLEVLIEQAHKPNLALGTDDIGVINENLLKIEEHLLAVGMRHTLELTGHAKADLKSGSKTTWKEALALFECIQVQTS